MDAQTYSNVTAACDQIAAKTQEPGISALSSRLHRALEKEHKPTMALVSFNMNHAERFAIIKDFTGTDVPGELAAKVDGASACIKAFRAERDAAKETVLKKLETAEP